MAISDTAKELHNIARELMHLNANMVKVTAEMKKFNQAYLDENRRADVRRNSEVSSSSPESQRD